MSREESLYRDLYDQVKELSDRERADMAKAPFDLEQYKEELGIKEVQGEAGYSTIERTGIRPHSRCKLNLGWLYRGRS